MSKSRRVESQAPQNCRQPFFSKSCESAEPAVVVAAQRGCRVQSAHRDAKGP